MAVVTGFFAIGDPVSTRGNYTGRSACIWHGARIIHPVIAGFPGVCYSITTGRQGAVFPAGVGPGVRVFSPVVTGFTGFTDAIPTDGLHTLANKAFPRRGVTEVAIFAWWVTRGDRFCVVCVLASYRQREACYE